MALPTVKYTPLQFQTPITPPLFSFSRFRLLSIPNPNSTSIPNSISPIIHRLRNLGLAEPETPRPDPAQTPLPWERSPAEIPSEETTTAGKTRRERPPTRAETTLEDSELRRLRGLAMTMRERISVAKAGVTREVVGKIHDAWRRSEIVRVKFHESLAHDMKMAHELVERRTGGLVIWRSGSLMVVYRGINYKRPSEPQSFAAETTPTNEENSKTFGIDFYPAESITEEEAEYNSLLDGLGPRFVDWWGTESLPVDADLLPPSIPGFKTPFRFLPIGARLGLTNAEMTDLRQLARKLPCHFALGRNRNHHGLAAAIIKLWEKSLVVKIAIKRGIQNTNNKIMAEELKTLTGGLLLLRNKFYIVIYRGKDFIPSAVHTALAEREQLTKDVQEIEEKARNPLVGDYHTDIGEGHALAGTLAEFQEAQARWGREVTAEEQLTMKEEASRSEYVRRFKKMEHKFSIAQAKMLRAERLLAKIEASMVPIDPSDDREMLTDEERANFRSIGLQMKAYLPLGIRGVFDGVIENMHLHWKHRELVKLISKQKTQSFAEDTARLLEYESGGILVAVERVPKGYALVYYRGKNYQRPISIRPRNLLTKAKALKRAVAMQRHEALSQHISELEKSMKEMKFELGYAEVKEPSDSNQEFSEVEDEDYSDSDEDYDSDNGDKNDAYESSYMEIA